MESRRVKYQLGAVSRIEAETFGQPGQRTFRLCLQAGAARCLVWLEKEQLFQLGIYLRDVIESLSQDDRGRQSQPREPEWAGEDTALDFKVGQLLLSHDPAGNSFYLQAYEMNESDPQGELASVSFWITIAQAEALGEEALRICAAGRPRCFLCALPINPEGHVCPRSNGHTVLEVG